MTEEQIERRAERMMDHLDRQYMAGLMSDKDYNHAVRELHRWCEWQYSKAD